MEDISSDPQIPAGYESARGGRPSSSTSRVRSRADPFLITCRCFSLFTSLAALLCITVNVLSAVRSFKDGSDIFDGIFRCYAVVIALLVVVAETEWEFVIKFSKVLEFWAGRGMLQILYVVQFMFGCKIPAFLLLLTLFFSPTIKSYVAVMTRAYPEYLSNRTELFLLQSIASYLLLACGAIYVISGILCMGVLKRARLKKEVSREQAAKDLEELDRRRQELEALLLEEHA